MKKLKSAFAAIKRKKSSFSKGAVSVFLVLILVPCMFVSSIFVDLGRVNLSRANAESAADLALNTLLTNYDYDLKEWYGLVSSCQNIKDFFKVSSDYFVKTVSAKGLSEDEIYLLSDYYSSVTGDNKVFNLLKTENIGGDNIISPKPNSALSNPSIMKDEIVEFMKYRGPIEITKDVIERLKNDNSVSDAIDSSKNEKLTDDKKEYFEAESELLEAAFRTYKELMKYHQLNYTNQRIIDDRKQVNGFRTSYKTVIKEIISKYYNTDATMFSFHRLDFNVNDSRYKISESSNHIRTRYEDKDGKRIYYINQDRIDYLFKKLENSMSALLGVKDSLEKDASTYITNLPSKNLADPVQWQVKATNVYNNHKANLSSKCDNFMSWYGKFLAMSKCELDDDVDKTAYKTDRSDLEKRAKGVADLFKKNPGSSYNNMSYIILVSEMEKISGQYYSVIANPSSNKIVIDSKNISVVDAPGYMGSVLRDKESKVDEAIEHLKNVIKGNFSKKIKSIDKLKELADKYRQKFNNWKGTANSLDTEMAEKDRKEIKEIEDITKNINSTSVSKLKTRLVNIRDQLIGYKNSINAFKLGGAKLKNVNGIDKFKNDLSSNGVSKSGIPYKKSELESYCNNIYDKITPKSGDVISLSNLNNKNYNLKIDPETKEVATPELFVYLHNEFKNLKEKDLDDAKKEKEKSEKQAEDTKKKANDGSRYHGGDKKGVSKEYSTGKKGGVLSSLGGAFDLIKNLVDGNFTSIRDNLYVTEYIMRMCSYGTYETEGKFKLYGKDHDSSALKRDNGYEPKEYSSSDIVEKWKSKDLKDTYNKSLTNKLIDKTNNQAYLAEVEYVLYGHTGEDSNKKNIKDAYNSILAIRVPLNLISGFANFYSPGNPTADMIGVIAASVSGATMGVIPEPLVKIVLITLLAALESIEDLNRLEAGFPVELYKKDHTNWRYAFPDGSKESVSSTDSSFSDFDPKSLAPSEKPAGNEGIYYSDYVTIFVYLGLTNNTVAPDIYRRLGEVIQTNMRKKEGIDKGYSLTKSINYFQLKAQLRVKPIMVSLPYFTSYDSLNTMKKTTDWCTYSINITRGY